MKTGGSHAESIRRCCGFIFDLDGTVYLSERLLPGAADAVGAIRSRGGKVLFLSNKPIVTSAQCAEKLSRLGVPCDAGSVLNSLDVFTKQLWRIKPAARVLPVGEELFEKTLAESGFTVTRNPDEAEVVAVAFDRTFDYDKLERAYRAAKRGALLAATNPDRLCPMDGYELPDCACMVAAIETACRRKFDLVSGKPSQFVIDEALERLELPAAQCALVGDRLETDIEMALRGGLLPILVLTGATTPAAAAQVQNDRIVVLENAGALARTLEG